MTSDELPSDLWQAGLRVLQEPDVHKKVRLGVTRWIVYQCIHRLAVLARFTLHLRPMILCTRPRILPCTPEANARPGSCLIQASLTRLYSQAFQDGQLPLPPLPVPQEQVDSQVPAGPARPSPLPPLARKVMFLICFELPFVCVSSLNQVLLLSDAQARPLESSIHGIAHAESFAIDLMWDLMVRFASDPALNDEEFYRDFVEIAEQEVRGSDCQSR